MSSEDRAVTVAAYADLRTRVSELVAPLDAETLARPARACPGWSVHDVLAHLVAVSTDVTRGRADGAGSPEWTAEQVAERRGRSAGELVAEWEAGSAAMDAVMSTGAGRQILSDALTHEQDLRVPLEAPYRPQDADLDSAMGFVGRGFSWVLAHHFHLPAFEARTSAATYLLGEGEPAAVLQTDTLDLLRSLMGRRTLDQITALRWSTDPAPWMHAFTWAVFVPPTEPTEPVLDPA